MLFETRSKADRRFTSIEAKRPQPLARVHPLEIAALRDLDLTDRQIAAYFGVAAAEIEAIRREMDPSAFH
jgi:hypothetical protein